MCLCGIRLRLACPELACGELVESVEGRSLKFENKKSACGLAVKICEICGSIFL